VTTGQGSGVLLVEAKSYPREIFGSGTRASEAARARIEAAMRKAKEALGIRADLDWLGPLYQSANRLAFLWFFRRHNVPAWLVNLYFVGGRGERNTTRDQWARELLLVKRALLGDEHMKPPGVVEVFLEARDPAG
jgi:hypothetical protein